MGVSSTAQREKQGDQATTYLQGAVEYIEHK